MATSYYYGLLRLSTLEARTAAESPFAQECLRKGTSTREQYYAEYVELTPRKGV